MLALGGILARLRDELAMERGVLLQRRLQPTVDLGDLLQGGSENPEDLTLGDLKRDV
jgi:hypothetical protein